MLNLEYLLKLFPAYDPTGHAPNKATRKGFKHQVNPTYKPPRAAQSPANWGRARRKARAEAEKKASE